MNLNQRPQFPALTGLRAVAAWLLFLYHFTPPFFEGNIGKAIATEGHIGVSIFFTLSGFLIANRYAFKGTDFRFKGYLINRFAKVYPLYAGLTTLTFLRLNVGGPDLYVLNMTFLRGFFSDFFLTGVAQGWTLTVEECFYILAPLIFITIHKTRWWLIIWPVLLACLGLLITWLPESFHPNGFLDTPSFVFPQTIFGRMFEFITGVALAWMYEFRKDHPILNFKNVTYLGLAMLLTTYALLVSFQSEQYSPGCWHPVGQYVHHLLLPVSTALFLCGLISETTWVSKFLSTKLMWWMGMASYAFYLVHNGIFHDAFVTLVSWNWWLRFLFLNALAFVAFIGFEYPVQQFIRNYNKQESLVRNVRAAVRSTIKLIKEH